MLKEVLRFTGVFAVMSAGLPQCLCASNPANDHLVPVDRALEQSGSGAAYRKLYEKKLLLTPGDVARFIFLPVQKGHERTASVYQSAKKSGALPGGYWVTATEPNRALWDFVKPQASRSMDPETIVVRSRDAPLPESTAHAIHKVWLAMLAASRRLPAAEILGESDTMIFSATTANGVVLRAQAHSFDSKNRALIEIGDGLVQFCDVPSSARAGVARKIEEAATVLFNRTQQDQERKRR